MPAQVVMAANDNADTVALGWARIAGLVEIESDGSWKLTPQGFAGMLDLLGYRHDHGAPALIDERAEQVLLF